MVPTVMHGRSEGRRCKYCNRRRAQQYRRPSWSYHHQSSPLSFSSNALRTDRLTTGRGVKTPPAYGNFVIIERSFRAAHSGYSIGIPTRETLYVLWNYKYLLDFSNTVFTPT